jgi:mannose-6-phosphate isomerase-like protein (cupin superfamily)
MEDRKPIILEAGEGRAYACGPMTAVFKADGAETAGRYSVSTWQVRPHSPGPGAHSHEANDEVFLVTEGRMAILVGDEWHEAGAGAVVIIPAGVTHDFENRSDAPATVFNVFMPGGFEKNMPAIVDWFAKQRS